MRHLRLVLAGLAISTALAGCVSAPRLNAGLSLGTGGLQIHPSVSGRIGGARVSVSP